MTSANLTPQIYYVVLKILDKMKPAGAIFYNNEKMKFILFKCIYYRITGIYSSHI